MTISVAIPTHQDRIKWFIQTIRKLYEVVDEFVVADDASGDLIQDRIIEAIKPYPKVRFLAHNTRQGAFRNKYFAVSKCKNEYVALLDSDNGFGVKYIEAFENSLSLRHTVPGICCPVMAIPRFNFSEYRNQIFMACNVAGAMKDELFSVLMNTGNYIINREKYLEILKPIYESKDQIPQCCDVIFTNYHLLKGGQIMYVIDGMKYVHLDHPESTYRQFVEKEPDKTLKWQNMVRGLR